MSVTVSIDVRNVSKIFGAGTEQQVTALNDVSVSIAQNEFFTLLGPSGCGKSTLLRAVAGLVPSESESFKTGFETPAFVFQDATLMPWRNVHDNVRLPLELRDPVVENSSDTTIIETIRQVLGEWQSPG